MYGFNLTPEAARERIAQLDVRLARAGRKRSDVRIFATPSWREPLSPDRLAQFRDAGVEQLIITLTARSQDDLLRKLDAAAKLAPAAAAL